MLAFLQHVFVLLARIFLSLFFLWNGVDLIANWGPRLEGLTSREVPQPMVLMGFGVFCLLVGGVLLIFGLRGRVGAFLLLLFLVPWTIALHGGWLVSFNLTDLSAHYDDITDLLQHLGLLGALLMVLGFGSGGFSLDLLLRKRKDAK